MDFLLTPPVAFLIYLPLVALILLAGKGLSAGPGKQSELKTSGYGSGESAPTSAAIPGYRTFFVVAFFFAILHLGMLVIGTGTLTPVMVPYLIGLILALLALILG